MTASVVITVSTVPSRRRHHGAAGGSPKGRACSMSRIQYQVAESALPLTFTKPYSRENKAHLPHNFKDKIKRQSSQKLEDMEIRVP